MDIFTFLVSVFLSGLVGVVITIWYSDWSAKQQTKLRVLQQLLGNRHNITGEPFTEALNQILIVFADTKRVITALKGFHAVVTEPFRTSEKVNESLLILIKSICRNTRIKVIEIEDKFFLIPFNTKNDAERIPRNRSDIATLILHFEQLSQEYQQRLKNAPSDSDESKQLLHLSALYHNNMHLLRWVTGDTEQFLIPTNKTGNDT